VVTLNYKYEKNLISFHLSFEFLSFTSSHHTEDRRQNKEGRRKTTSGKQHPNFLCRPPATACRDSFLTSTST